MQKPSLTSKHKNDRNRQAKPAAADEGVSNKLFDAAHTHGKNVQGLAALIEAGRQRELARQEARRIEMLPFKQLPPVGTAGADGVTHINMSNEGVTVLGQALSIFTDALPFYFSYVGNIQNIDGLWRYIRTGNRDRKLLGEMYNKRYMNLQKEYAEPALNERVIILVALYQRIMTYPDLHEELKRSKLPLDMYLPKSKVRIRPAAWIVKGVEEIRSAIKRNRAPDLYIFMDTIDPTLLPDDKRADREIEVDTFLETFFKADLHRLRNQAKQLAAKQAKEAKEIEIDLTNGTVTTELNNVTEPAVALGSGPAEAAGQDDTTAVPAGDGSAAADQGAAAPAAEAVDVDHSADPATAVAEPQPVDTNVEEAIDVIDEGSGTRGG